MVSVRKSLIMVSVPLLQFVSSFVVTSARDSILFWSDLLEQCQLPWHSAVYVLPFSSRIFPWQESGFVKCIWSPELIYVIVAGVPYPFVLFCFFTIHFFFFFFGCAGSSLLCSGFSLVGREQGLLSSCSSRLFIAVASLVASTGSGFTGFRSCSTWSQ